MEKLNAFDYEAIFDHLLDGNCDLKLEIYVEDGKNEAKLRAREFLIQLERKIMNDIEIGFGEEGWVTDPRRYFLISHDRLFMLSEDFIHHAK